MNTCHEQAFLSVYIADTDDGAVVHDESLDALPTPPGALVEPFPRKGLTQRFGPEVIEQDMLPGARRPEQGAKTARVGKPQDLAAIQHEIGVIVFAMGRFRRDHPQ